MTQDPIIIALGLGVGALFVRSMTIYLVREGTLAEYRYLEHGAHWAIGALAIMLLLTIRFHVGEIVIGLIGITFILAAWFSSVRANRREDAQGLRRGELDGVHDTDDDDDDVARDGLDGRSSDGRDDRGAARRDLDPVGPVGPVDHVDHVDGAGGSSALGRD